MKNRKRIKSKVVIAVLLAVSFLMTACGKNSSTATSQNTGGDSSAATTQETAAPTAAQEVQNTDGPVTGGDFSYALATVPTTLDPHKSGWAVETRIIRQIYDRLIDIDSKGEFVPYLAKEWSVSEDGKTYTFQLRDDVTFHDGTKFNAEAVKYNLDRYTNPEISTTGAVRLSPYSSNKVTGEYTIELNLDAPSATFLTNLVHLSIVSPAAAEAEGDQFGLKPVGSGPFIFDSWGEDIVLKRNPEYKWGPSTVENTGAPYLNTLTFKIITEEATRLGAVQSQQVNAAEAVPPQNYVFLQSDDSVQVLKKDVEGLSYTLFFNLAREPWSNLELRQAVQAAIDTSTIIKTIYFDVYGQAYGPVTAITPGYAESLTGVSYYDPEKAKKLLEDAGWVVGDDGIRVKDGKRLTLQYEEASPNREKRNDVAVVVQNQLKAIGIEVNVNISTNLTAKLQAHDFDLWGNNYQSLDPISSLRTFYHSKIQAWTGVNDSGIDELLDSALTETDTAKRNELLKDTQEELVKQVYSIPIYNFTYTVAATSDVKNLKLLTLAIPDFVDVYLKAE